MLDDTHAPGISSRQQDVGTACSSPTPSGSRPAWCVVSTYAAAEFRAERHLREQGFTTYLPLVLRRRTHRFIPSRNQTVLSPLFPAYLFLQLDPDRPWRPVLNTPGVFDLIRQRDTGFPATCPQDAVDALRRAEASRRSLPAESSSWAPGVPCSLATGAFYGLPAVVLTIHGDTATIGLMMLGHLRQISVPIDSLRARDDAG